VAISCAALPETLLEAELFGHEKGAFTDAHKERKGRFELAQGGTLFLDDIDDMPLAVQVKLLRVLQERNFERLGSEETRTLDIRVVAATKKPLRELVREGRFREDLYYRIHVVPVALPPLRERAGDVPLLLQHMVERYGKGKAYHVSTSTMNLLERYPWPGNVRELENAIQRAIALAGDGPGALEGIPAAARSALARRDGAAETVRPLREVLREAEVAHIKRALDSPADTARRPPSCSASRARCCGRSCATSASIRADKGEADEPRPSRERSGDAPLPEIALRPARA
jgi:transcriptional regulator with GAF, ATPase, and Fis domain